MAGGSKRAKRPSAKSAKGPSETLHPSSGGRTEMDEVLKVILGLARDPMTAPLAESVANTLLGVIGSGPSFAAMQSMVAANQANGQMYFNAVANQQMTNIVGMVATMNCVNALLDKPGPIPWPNVTGAPLADADDENF